MYRKILSLPLKELLPFKMIKISKARLSEAQPIRVLEQEAHGEEVTSRYDAALIVRFGYAYVATENGKIIGAITAWQTRNGEVKINDWVVHPEHRRKGIGAKLYRKLLEEAQGKVILALVDEKNSASANAHRKLGFTEVERVDDAYGKGDEQVLWRLENRQ